MNSTAWHVRNAGRVNIVFPLGIGTYICAELTPSSLLERGRCDGCRVDEPDESRLGFLFAGMAAGAGGDTGVGGGRGRGLGTPRVILLGVLRNVEGCHGILCKARDSVSHHEGDESTRAAQEQRFKTGTEVALIMEVVLGFEGSQGHEGDPGDGAADDEELPRRRRQAQRGVAALGWRLRRTARLQARALSRRRLHLVVSHWAEHHWHDGEGKNGHHAKAGKGHKHDGAVLDAIEILEGVGGAKIQSRPGVCEFAAGVCLWNGLERERSDQRRYRNAWQPRPSDLLARDSPETHRRSL